MRKFRDTKETDPRSDWILERIGKLYKLERAIALVAGGDPPDGREEY